MADAGVRSAPAAPAGPAPPEPREGLPDQVPSRPGTTGTTHRYPRRQTGARPLHRSLAVLGVLATLASAMMIGAGTAALVQLGRAREQVVSVVDPAMRDATVLSAALLNQETGLRGYLLGRRADLLDPYLQGGRDEDAAAAALAVAADDPDLSVGADLEAVRDLAGQWRREYAEPAIAAVRAGRPPPAAEQGSALFDQVRVALSRLQADLDDAAGRSRADLSSAATTLQWVFGGIALGLLVLLVVLALGVRRVVTRPISDLATGVRRVADGDFDAVVVGTGPREVVELGGDVDAMRRQILAELSALRAASDRLDRQAQELERSNAELEQFAYVASHDLQEPLRKVASFTQLLERRYKGQLDDRADQYISFAVDGAKRMQGLINDLLAFSRVGRLLHEHVEVDAGDLVAQALGNLSLAIEDTGTEVTVDELPRVHGDISLLTGVFQNLISNAVKFRGDVPARIHVGVRDAGDQWEFSVADNGIGIEPEYAERIFVIFQRLHSKDAYPGTGIGLAMCRKIVEYHGGRIWLDTDVAGTAGTTFRFTLPKLASPPDGTASTADTAADPVPEEPETTG
jgi:signal transduction histidine kinase